MHYTPFLAIALAIASYASAQSASVSDITSIPACFLNCATQAAADAKCQGVADLACVCVSTPFIQSNEACAKACPESANAAVAQASFDLFTSICKKTVGGKFNLTMPAALANASSALNTTSASGGGTAASKTDAALVTLPPSIQHLVSATLVFGALLGGVGLICP